VSYIVAASGELMGGLGSGGLRDVTAGRRCHDDRRQGNDDVRHVPLRLSYGGWLGGGRGREWKGVVDTDSLRRWSLLAGITALRYCSDYTIKGEHIPWTNTPEPTNTHTHTHTQTTTSPGDGGRRER